jgi:hypothetical protein
MGRAKRGPQYPLPCCGARGAGCFDRRRDRRRRSGYGTVNPRTGTVSLPVRPTERDQEILAALDRCPLTILQILKLSEIFQRSFTSRRCVQDRLHTLALRGHVHRFQYAVPGRGTMNYYTLSREGYRLLHGHEARLPGHRFFEEQSESRLPHTQALADFIVHTVVAAHRSGIRVIDFHRENALRLEAGTEELYPDCAFRLHAPDDRVFEFFVEIDNGTETVATLSGRGLFERKILFYEAYRDQCEALGQDHRFRVVLVTTKTETRLSHLLTRTKELLRSKNRPLLYGITLERYLATEGALEALAFHDHRRQPRALVPPASATLSPTVRAATAAIAKAGAF